MKCVAKALPHLMLEWTNLAKMSFLNPHFSEAAICHPSCLLQAEICLAAVKARDVHCCFPDSDPVSRYFQWLHTHL